MTSSLHLQCIMEKNGNLLCFSRWFKHLFVQKMGMQMVHASYQYSPHESGWDWRGDSRVGPVLSSGPDLEITNAGPQPLDTEQINKLGIVDIHRVNVEL